ncbi:hypothetical protein BDV98DRAFT_586327 [Pterulicium gracile]|uniref:Uncharacterized protein n=1 Tax=Pterulicium gracile TaxID=1884261 RepID=A0A5C3Q7R9_9AGAR|nr:hypothetical protein BDV98DRAFT_586327 [Pterula gracilis]
MPPYAYNNTHNLRKKRLKRLRRGSNTPQKHAVICKCINKGHLDKDLSWKHQDPHKLKRFEEELPELQVFQGCWGIKCLCCDTFGNRTSYKMNKRKEGSYVHCRKLRGMSQAGMLTVLLLEGSKSPSPEGDNSTGFSTTTRSSRFQSNISLPFPLIVWNFPQNITDLSGKSTQNQGKVSHYLVELRSKSVTVLGESHGYLNPQCLPTMQVMELISIATANIFMN